MLYRNIILTQQWEAELIFQQGYHPGDNVSAKLIVNCLSINLNI